MENVRNFKEKSMNLDASQWKIVQSRAWRCVGPPWCLLECLFGVLERFGSVLGASWHPLGTSWRGLGGADPKGLPTWTPFGAQNLSKIDQKLALIFRSIFFVRFWSENGHRMASQTFQKRSKKVIDFSIDFAWVFWMDFGAINPWR